jgi:hypothetical protein
MAFNLGKLLNENFAALLELLNIVHTVSLLRLTADLEAIRHKPTYPA